jgi:hypothetical protein
MVSRMMIGTSRLTAAAMLYSAILYFLFLGRNLYLSGQTKAATRTAVLNSQCHNSSMASRVAWYPRGRGPSERAACAARASFPSPSPVARAAQHGACRSRRVGFLPHRMAMPDGTRCQQYGANMHVVRHCAPRRDVSSAYDRHVVCCECAVGGKGTRASPSRGRTSTYHHPLTCASVPPLPKRSIVSAPSEPFPHGETDRLTKARGTYR